MTTNMQIEHYLKNQPHFIGVYASNTLPHNPPVGSSLIVNYSDSNSGGSHWVAMRNLNTSNVEFFDSYGFDADQDDLILSVHTKFKDYLKKHSKNKNYKVNRINFQCSTSDVCGEYATKFIKDGLPELVKNGRVVVNPKWKQYVLKSDKCAIADRWIRHEIKLRR